MRRRLAVLAVLPLLLTACGGSGGSGGEGGQAASPPPAIGTVSVSGEVGKKPTVTFTPGRPATTSSSTVLREGTGKPLKMGDAVVANLTAYTWDGKQNASGGSTYDTGVPEVLPVSDQLPKVVREALVGARPGGRFYSVVAADNYTAEQREAAKAQGADLSAAQVFVVDIVDVPDKLAATGKAVDPGLEGVTLENPGGEKAPVLTTKTDEKAPPKLVAKTVIKGKGEKIKAGQNVLVQYVGKIWGSDVEFDSSWSRGIPSIFQIGSGKVIKGWDQGLVGVPLGSRMLLSIPPDLGYGKEGTGQIKGTDTLVFAIDVLDTY